MPKKLKEILPLLADHVAGTKKHDGYADSVKQWKRLRIHADGEIPGELLEKQRPNEGPVEFAYRKQIFKSVSKGTMSRIFTCVGKIRKSRDFVIKFPSDKIPGSLPKEEHPIVFFNEEFPSDETFEDWIFNVLMRTILIDTGAVLFVYPSPMTPESSDEYPTPVPVIYNSDQVLEYREKDYCLVKSHETATYKTVNGSTMDDGKVFYLATSMETVRLEQIDEKGTVKATGIYEHKKGKMAARKLPGVYKKRIGNYALTESRIDTVADRLDEASREWSDFQISKVLNAHPESVEFRNVECAVCSGSGMIVNPLLSTDPDAESPIICGRCHGDRYTVSGPFKRLVQTPSKATENPAPWPPKVFIERDVECLKFMREEIALHIEAALASINMEHLAKAPSSMAESGIKKAQDVDELNVLVYSIACDLMATASWAADWMIEIRYEVRIPKESDRKQMYIIIPVPERLDLLNTENYLARIKQAKDAGVSPYIINEMQKELVAKQFSNEPEKEQLMQLISNLDPLPGLSHDEKALLKSNGAISTQDLIISAHIYPWTAKLLRDKKLVGKSEGEELEEKLRQAMIEMADKEIEKANETQQAIMKQLMPEEEDDADADEIDPKKKPAPAK